MATASSLTTCLFGLIVAAVATLFLYATIRTGRVASGFGVLLVWVAVPGVLAWRGVLNHYDPPPPALLLIAALTAATIVLSLSQFGSRIGGGFGIAALVGFQVFRVPVEWLLHRLYLEGVIPVQMTYAGWNFDIVSGVTAGALALWLARGGRSPRLVLAWNVLGLALLLTIVIIAATSTPTILRLFPNEPANRLLGIFPYVWLPSFLVQAALFGHIVVFRSTLAALRGGSMITSIPPATPPRRRPRHS